MVHAIPPVHLHLQLFKVDNVKVVMNNVPHVKIQRITAQNAPSIISSIHTLALRNVHFLTIPTQQRMSVKMDSLPKSPFSLSLSLELLLPLSSSYLSASVNRQLPLPRSLPCLAICS